LAQQHSFPFMQIKEKYGTLRIYCAKPRTDEDMVAYRAIYETLCSEYATLYREILDMADWPELLVGIIDQDACEHTEWTRGDGKKFCRICGKVFK